MSFWNDASDLLKAITPKVDVEEEYTKLVAAGRAPKLTPGKSTTDKELKTYQARRQKKAELRASQGPFQSMKDKERFITQTAPKVRRRR
tara:strand:- start:219 stop:485 length:267 start_codon:yes stop_codon:yes gene_type:complete